jgi:hypothetical protein
VLDFVVSMAVILDKAQKSRLLSFLTLTIGFSLARGTIYSSNQIEGGATSKNSRQKKLSDILLIRSHRKGSNPPRLEPLPDSTPNKSESFQNSESG